MKHSRDENPTRPHVKGFPVSCTELSDGLHPRAAAEQPSRDDALSYLMIVRDTLKDQKEVYDKFLQVLVLFKHERITYGEVVSRAKKLLKGHCELLEGFDAFLVEGYKITAKKPVKFSEAVSFVNKVKHRFSQQEHTYQAFVEVLKMYEQKEKSDFDVFNEVASLFRDDQDLLEDFMHYMPDTIGLACPHPMQEGLGGSVPRKGERAMLFNSPQHGKLVKRKKMATTQYDRGLSPVKQLANDCMNEADKENHKKAKYERNEKEKDEEDSKLEDELDSHASQHLSKTCKPVQKADGVILPNSLQKRLGFFDKLRMRLDENNYQEFLKCLKMYTEEIITRADLDKLVDDIFGSFKELMDGLNEFLNFCENNGLDEGTCSKLKVGKDNEMLEVSKEFERYREKDGVEHKTELEAEKEKEKLSSQSPRDPLNDQENYLENPVSELDLSSCEHYTPSCQLLQERYPSSEASDLKEGACLVLNDSWVSVASGSEDYSLKQKNMYKEILVQCEDDRFELDMLLETTNATIERVEELLEKYQEDTGALKDQVRVEDYLKAIHTRCIERIYGDHGLDFVQILAKNVSGALPVILRRLKQKQKEWSKCRVEMNKIWADIYANCYH